MILYVPWVQDWFSLEILEVVCAWAIDSCDPLGTLIIGVQRKGLTWELFLEQSPQLWIVRVLPGHCKSATHALVKLRSSCWSRILVLPPSLVLVTTFCHSWLDQSSSPCDWAFQSPLGWSPPLQNGKIMCLQTNFQAHAWVMVAKGLAYTHSIK